MSTFLVSHPFLLDGAAPTVRAFVTRDQIDDLGAGTVALAQQVLDDLALAARATACRVTLYRSAYWSGHLASPDWQDVWPPAWQVDIAVDRAPRIARHDEAERPTSAFDASFTRDQHYFRLDRFPCLVVADVKRKAAADQAEAAVRARDWSAYTAPLGLGPPAVRRGQWMGRGPQLHVDLGVVPASFYAAGAAYGVAVMDVLRGHGANLNVEELEDWAA